MRNLTKAAGLLFLAASSVYSDGVLRAAGVAPVKSVPPTVRALDDVFDPVSPPATQPATRPATPATRPAAAAAKPVQPGDVNVKDFGTVEIHVNDASLVEVLRMLSLQAQKNIVASKDVRGTVSANLYDVTIKEALESILKPNGFDYREKGNFLYVYTAKEIADMEKAAQVKKTEIFRLYYTPAANAANMIKPVLSEGSQVSFTTPAKTGIGSDDKDAGGDSHSTEDVMVVTDFPERLDQVRAVLKEVDRRPQQVLVEAVILRATLQDNNDLGVDFTALGGVDFNTLGGLGSGTAAGSGLGQALSGQITENPTAGPVNDKGFVAGRAGGSGLKLGVVKNNVGLFISALEGVTDTVVLANPKVLVLNKQKGEVHVGSEQGYRTAVATETLTADDVKFLETGTRLIFRPFVGDNGNIRLEVHPEDSSGSVNAQGLPNKFVTQVTTNVMVRDGHTVVIGGLFRDATDRTRSQVPGLGSLPGIGAAFRRQTDNTVREEVIILLTPHIVKDEAAYAAAGAEMLKDAERLRVGMRQGLMPWGRDRLAESWYQKAVEEMNKPNPDRQKALWHLNAATNLNPQFAEAVKLKVSVTGSEAAVVDSSVIRSFVARQILADRASGAALPPASPTTVPSLPGADARKPDTRPAVVVSAPGHVEESPAPAEAKKPEPATQPVVEVGAVTNNAVAAFAMAVPDTRAAFVGRRSFEAN